MESKFNNPAIENICMATRKQGGATPAAMRANSKPHTIKPRLGKRLRKTMHFTVEVRVRKYPALRVYARGDNGLFPVTQIEISEGSPMTHQAFCKLIQAEFPQVTSYKLNGQRLRANHNGCEAIAYQVVPVVELASVTKVKGFEDHKEVNDMGPLGPLVYVTGKLLKRSEVVREIKVLAIHQATSNLAESAREHLKANPGAKRFIRIEPGHYVVLHSRNALKVDTSLPKR